MALSYDKIISSTPFQFLVGPKKKLLTIHAALVCHYSKPLGAMITGGMAETMEGRGTLLDVDEHTFTRFAQFVYTGDYDAADPEILLDASKIGGDNTAEATHLDDSSITANLFSLRKDHVQAFEFEDDWDFDARPKTKKKNKAVLRDEDSLKGAVKDNTPEPPFPLSKNTKVWREFASKIYCELSLFMPRKNSEECEDYSDVFLCHARLYVFAEKYDITKLQTLCLDKLQRTLAVFKLYPERARDIAALIEYSYKNTGDHRATNDELRTLVVLYAACAVEHLTKNGHFSSVLEDIGEFWRDLALQTVKRIE